MKKLIKELDISVLKTNLDNFSNAASDLLFKQSHDLSLYLYQNQSLSLEDNILVKHFYFMIVFSKTA